MNGERGGVFVKTKERVGFVSIGIMSISTTTGRVGTEKSMGGLRR